MFTFVITLAFAWVTVAQPTMAAERKAIEQANESGGWWFSIVIIIIGIGGLGFFLWRRKNPTARSNNSTKTNSYTNFDVPDTYEVDGMDAEMDISRLRKQRRVVQKKRSGGPANSKHGSMTDRPVSLEDLNTKEYSDRLRRNQFESLPINSIEKLSASKPIELLPSSDDPALMSAIEQASDEFEEDERVRELAVRVLAAFKTENSIEALSQIALYDLSATIRSMAIGYLAEFDHPSVFEPILLSCADPTREVKASAARGLFRLTFDRADAWKRIIETNDDFRMVQAVRAAGEAGLVTRSFERLTHDDYKITMESFALVSLVILSGETDVVFDALENHSDDCVKFALLHLISIHQDPRSLARLEKFMFQKILPQEVREKVESTIKNSQHVFA